MFLNVPLENYVGQFSGCQGSGGGQVASLGVNLRSLQASWNCLIPMVHGVRRESVLGTHKAEECV